MGNHRAVLSHLMLALALIYSLFQFPQAHFADFNVYLRAVQAWSEGQPVYGGETFYQFKYSPFALAFFSLPIRMGLVHLAFYLFNLGAWMGLIFLWLKAYVSKVERPFALIFVLFFFFNALLRDLKFGQFNALPALLAYLAFVRFDRAQNWKPKAGSALLLALSLQFKLYWAILFPLLLMRKRYQEIALATVFFVLLNFSVAGGSELLLWLQNLSSSTQDILLKYSNTSLMSLMAKLGLSPWLYKALWGIAVSAFYVLCYRWRDKDIRLHFALGGICVVLLNPIAWSYWILLLIPAALILAHQWRNQPKYIALVPAFFIFLSFNAQNAEINRTYGLTLSALLFTLLFVKELLLHSRDSGVMLPSKT